MLREMHRVLKPGGVLSFLTITLTEGLTPEQRQRGMELGEPEDDAGPGFSVLVPEAGFVDVDIEDVTEEYSGTLQRLLYAYVDESADLIDLLGEEDFEERLARRRRYIQAVGEGLHSRYWVTARKGLSPGGRLTERDF